MAKKRRRIELDPAEDWLADILLGDFRKVLSPSELREEIKRVLRGQVDELLEQTGQTGPFIDLEPIYPYRRILKVSEASLDDKTKAVMVPVRGGFKIDINRKLNFVSKRITLAHEIGHTFLYDINTETPSMPYQKSESRFWVREGYAREIGRVILVPDRSVISIAKRQNLTPSVKSLRYLVNRYKVSHDLLRRRLMDDLKLWDCVIFNPRIDTDGNINIDPKDTSKGGTFDKLTMPKQLLHRHADTDYRDLRLFLLSAFEQKYKKGRVFFKNVGYGIESTRQFHRGKQLLAIICRRDSDGDENGDLFQYDKG